MNPVIHVTQLIPICVHFSSKIKRYKKQYKMKTVPKKELGDKLSAVRVCNAPPASSPEEDEKSPITFITLH